MILTADKIQNLCIRNYCPQLLLESEKFKDQKLSQLYNFKNIIQLLYIEVNREYYLNKYP